MVLVSDGIFSPEVEPDLRFGSLLTLPSLATAESFSGLRIFLGDQPGYVCVFEDLKGI